MRIFKKKEDNVHSLIEKINKSFLPQKYCYLIFGVFLSAFTFNMFFSPYNIVSGGGTGTSLIVRYWFGIDPSLFVFILSIILIFLSFFLLGVKTTVKSIVGYLLLPIFMKITEQLTGYFNFDDTSIFLICIYGGVLSGLASGIIFKTGFSGGGFDIVYQLLNKYLKISLGLSSRIVNIVIVGIGAFIFGIDKAMYAIIALFISTFVMDRVLLGVSNSKTFYIITNREKEVKDFIINNLAHSVTIIDSKGGYSNDRGKILLCSIPTKQYFYLKEVVLEIDDKAFFLITDAYEVVGGH